MGNRSWLYLEHRTVADDEEADSTEVGAANNNFPVLWQILLADGAPGAAIDHQRVFGDAGTRNLTSDAHAALGRIRRMQAFVAQHPMLHALPQIALQFDALVLHLAALIDDAPAGTRARFSANLDELSWMDGDTQQEGFMERSRHQCNTQWADVQRCIGSGNHPGFDAELGLKRFADWEGWAWQFGLGGISHPYFNGYEPPRDEGFEEFMADQGNEEDGEDADDDEDRDWNNHLGGSLWRFEAGGLWGVRFSRDGDSRTVVAPAWDDIRTSGASDARLLWVSRGEHTGLLLADTDAPRLLLEPQLDEAWDFEDDIATALVGDHIGLLRADGSWLLAPSVDEVWSFAGGMARARVGERLGYVDAQGRWAVAPRFDEAEDFAPCGLAPAHTEAGWGLVRTDGEWAVPPGFDTLEWHHDWDAFEATRGGKTGLIDAQGRVAVEPLYEVLELLEEYPVEALEEADAPPVHAPVSRPKRFAVQRTAGQCGLIDALGRVLVPFDYGLFESLEPLTGPERAHAMVQRDLVRVASKGGRTAKNAPWLRGIFDIGAGRELVPCRHRTVQPLTWGTQDIGWLVADPLPRAAKSAKTDKTDKGQLAVGILRADGSTLYPQAYPWIGMPVSVGEGWYAVLVRSELRKRWSAGEPVKAARNDRDVYVWLHADGREQTHAAHMAARHAAGDLRAAYELACHLRDGEGIEADPLQALQWMARAAGVRTPGDAPASASAAGSPEAMRELALMLRRQGTEGMGGGTDLVRARAWLVHAVAHGGAEDADTQAQLGYMLCEGWGGERDAQAGVRHYEVAAERGSPMALFNLGLALRDGELVGLDLARAAGYFRRSDELGDDDGTLQLGVTLRRQAVQASEAGDAAQATVLYAEAAYAFQKLAEDDDSRLQGWGCYELGMLRFHGHGAPRHVIEAERWLLAGAALADCEQNLESQRACVEDLAQVLYGDRESPLFDAHKAAEWAQRLLALPGAAPD